MPTKLVRLRRSAYTIQSGNCYYCGLPMCEGDLKSFASVNRLTLSQARVRKCTAEHLQARQDGGKDVAGNIVAACSYCNSRRHRRKKPRDPDAFRALVQRRVSRGRWHCSSQPAPRLCTQTPKKEPRRLDAASPPIKIMAQRETVSASRRRVEAWSTANQPDRIPAISSAWALTASPTASSGNSQASTTSIAS